MCVRVPPVISTMIYSWARSTVVGEEAQVTATTRHDTPILRRKERSNTNLRLDLPVHRRGQIPRLRRNIPHYGPTRNTVINPAWRRL